MTLLALAWALSLAIQSATRTLLEDSLLSANPLKHSRSLLKQSFLLTLLLNILLSAFAVLSVDTLAHTLSSVPELVPVIRQNLPFLCLFLVASAGLTSLKAALMAFGEGKLAQYLAFCGFFLAGHPLSIYLFFYQGLPVASVPVGFALGALVTGLLYYVRIWHFGIDWEGLAQAARQRRDP